MSLTIEFHIPIEHQEAHNNDKIGKMVTQLDARKFLVAFHKAGLLDEINDDLDIVVEGRPDIPEGRMTVFVNGYTVNFEITSGELPSNG